MAVIADIKTTTVVSVLSPAILTGYIQPVYAITSAEEFEQNHSAFKFVHDRVHESFYRLLPPKELSRLHYKIGSILKRQGEPRNWTPSYLFCVTHHLNEARILINDESELKSLVALNISSSSMASKGGAYQQALAFSETGMELLLQLTPGDAKVWDVFYSDMVPLKQAVIECLYLLGQYEQAKAEFELLLSNVKTTADRIKSYTVFASLLSTLGKYEEARKQHLKVLDELGISIVDLGMSLDDKWKHFLAAIPNGSARYFKTLPIDDSDEVRNLMEENLFELSVTAYFLQDIDMHASVLMTGLYSW